VEPTPWGSSEAVSYTMDGPMSRGSGKAISAYLTAWAG